MTTFEEAQVVAVLEDNARAHTEIDRLRLVAAALTEALDDASTYLHEITDEGRNLEDPDDSEDYGNLQERISAALALARAEVKPVESCRSCDAPLVNGRCPAFAEVKP